MNLFTLKSGELYKYATGITILFISLNSFSQQAWTHVPSPNTSVSRNMLRDISGTSSTDVWTVGSFETPGGKMQNLIMHWNGSDWQIFPNTDLSISLNELWSITAVSTNDVWTAGVQNNYANTRSQLMHWNGSSWSHTSLPDITGGSFLFSIDAITVNDIWAVGTQAGSPTDPAYAIHYNGSNWNEFPVPNVGTYSNRLYAVDGISSNDVWAVGRKSDSYGDFHALVLHWDGSSWTNSTLPSSISSPIGDLESVTMITSNDVWALGSTITGGILLIHWDGTSWSEVPTAGSSGGKIVARGADIFSVGTRISQWNGSSWTVIDSLNQLTYPTLGSAISFSNGDIWAAGHTYDGAFHTLVYRTANSIPQFVHGNSQSMNMSSNSSPQNIDEMLKVQDADVSQVVTYTLLTPPSHGITSGLPDTAITNNGFAMTSGVTYMPEAGFTGSDQLVVKVSVGPLTSQVTINVSMLSALPVILTNYSINKLGSTVRIQWATSSEFNALEYILERSQDGTSFSAVNRIAAHGSGYNYILIDPAPFAGVNYYRLREVDLDGRIMTFPVKILHFDSRELKPFTVYPNPVAGNLMNVWLNIAGQCTLSLYDQTGKLILKKTINNSVSSSIQLNLPGNLKGVYLFSLNMGKTQYSEKIFIR